MVKGKKAGKMKVYWSVTPPDSPHVENRVKHRGYYKSGLKRLPVWETVKG
jgi:hypothetical protein